MINYREWLEGKIDLWTEQYHYYNGLIYEAPDSTEGQEWNAKRLIALGQKRAFADAFVAYLSQVDEPTE